MSQIQLPKTIKNVIRLQNIKQFTKPANIFSICKNSPSTVAITSNYDVVGDAEFKKKFCQQNKSQRLNRTTNEFKTLEQTNFNTTFCNYTRQIQEGTLAGKLSKAKQLELTRHRRTFMQFETNCTRDQKIEKHLKRRLSHFGQRKINNTITFEKQQIQLYPNPELIELVNDNVPEYWKDSLRDNSQRLKKHIKGNKFKRQVAEELLQTLRGRKTLVESMPKVKQQHFSPICSRKYRKPQHKRTFSIRGQKMSPCLQHENSKQNFMTENKIPRLQFFQTHKINYNSANSWKAFQLC